MKKALVIVESPAKARSIGRYLGDDYVVSSSAGHVRDLPASGTGMAVGKRAKAGSKKPSSSKRDAAMERLVRRMGIDPEKGWSARYEIIPGKEKIVAQLRRLASDAETVYLATDRDREGEAIAWHLQELVQRPEQRYLRVVFNEITQRAVRASFEQPQELNMDRVQAQQARRFLDRIVGFMLSPLLWRKVARGLSAGRVQSVAVRLLVERERAIRVFLPEEFWELKAGLHHRRRAGDSLGGARGGWCQIPSVQRVRSVGGDGRSAALPAAGERIQWQAGAATARASTDHLDAATSGQQPTWLWCAQDDDFGAAALRGGLHQLYAHRLDAAQQ